LFIYIIYSILYYYISNYLIKVILNHESGSVRRYPRDETDSKAIKQIITGQYGYASNALWRKQVFKEALIKKVMVEVSLECEQLCSLINPSILRDASPNGLKSFNETAHVEELQKKAPIFHSILQASASSLKGGSKCDSKHGVNPRCSISISMAASALLRARCPQMSVQSYRLALVLWHSGARKQVCII
jgi:hypothetical protein